MVAQRHSIFRDKALKHYTQGRKKDILPNFSSIPVAIFGWVLLGSLVATGLVAWLGQVPVYLPGTGIVLGKADPASGANALAFFAPIVSCVLYAAVAIIWVVPDRRIERHVMPNP